MSTAPQAPRAPRALARIEHSEALLVALRARVAELKLTHEIIDHLAGFQSGYCSKLLANPPLKRMGHFSLFLLLQTLALDMVLVENPDALEVLADPAHHRRAAVMLKRPGITFTPDFLKRNGIKGGRARAAKLSARQLSAIGRRGARVRWANEG